MIAAKAPIDQARVEAANRLLALLHKADDMRLEFKGRRAFVCWTCYRGGPQRYQWVTRGQDFYPTWYRSRGPWGGTMSTALSQLIRWCQGKPVFPMATWEYWVSPTVGMGGHRGGELLAMLRAAGYPERVLCVQCGQEPKGLDWYSFDGVSGPCCQWASCRRRDRLHEQQPHPEGGGA